MTANQDAMDLKIDVQIVKLDEMDDKLSHMWNLRGNDNPYKPHQMSS
jgi:hypothetical protein